MTKKSTRRGKVRGVRLSEDEYARVCAAAQSAAKTPHAFMRDVVLDAASARDFNAQMRGVEAAIRSARRAGVL